MEQIKYKKIHDFYRDTGFIKNLKNFLQKKDNAGYSFIENTKEEDDVITNHHLVINDIEEQKNKNLFKEILKYDFIWVYLHGSYGDNSITAFSDFDDLIIIDTEKLSIKNFSKVKKALRKIDMRFCYYDFLQHHGHWIIMKRNLQNYDASYMPLSVIKKSKIINGPDKIRYSINETHSHQGLKKNIIQTVNNIKTLYNDYQYNKINIYNLKRLAGSYVLIPPMLFQIKGTEITKAEAIKRSTEIFSPEALKSIKWSSFCRNHWEEIYKFPSVRLFRLFRLVFSNPFLYRKFTKKYSPVINLKRIGFDFLKPESSDKFCSETLNHIKNEV